MDYRTSITAKLKLEYDEFADNIYYDILRPCFMLLVH